jgi:hypothetical protein
LRLAARVGLQVDCRDDGVNIVVFQDLGKGLDLRVVNLEEGG